MRITGKSAQDVSKYANEISGGRIGLAQLGGDIGHGSRVIDGNQQIVWLGKPRHATAYYLGQVVGVLDVRGMSIDDMPAEVRAIHDEITESDRRPDVLEWFERGKSAGNYRANLT